MHFIAAVDYQSLRWRRRQHTLLRASGTQNTLIECGDVLINNHSPHHHRSSIIVITHTHTHTRQCAEPCVSGCALDGLSCQLADAGTRGQCSNDQLMSRHLIFRFYLSIARAFVLLTMDLKNNGCDSTDATHTPTTKSGSATACRRSVRRRSRSASRACATLVPIRCRSVDDCCSCVILLTYRGEFRFGKLYFSRKLCFRSHAECASTHCADGASGKVCCSAAQCSGTRHHCRCVLFPPQPLVLLV